MEIDKDFALALWDGIFGKDKIWAQDCFGTWMYKYDYGKTGILRQRPGGNGKTYTYGWCIDHIKPQSSFKEKDDSTFLNNLEPMHYVNNNAKSNDEVFTINGITYEICSCDICEKAGLLGYGIKNKNTGKRVDWKGATNRYYGR